MFFGHIAFSTSLVTFVLGLVLLAWSKKETAAASILKKGAYFVLILSLSNMFCISYYMVKYWSAGYYETPVAMMSCPMMKDMMQHDMSNNAPAAQENHEAHH